MDVFAVTDVDAYVVCAAAPEYEVARLKITEGHWCCCSLLAIGDTWDGDAVFSVNILNQAAAVEAAWAGAAPYIWHTEVFHGTGDDGTSGAVGNAIDDFINSPLVDARGLRGAVAIAVVGGWGVDIWIGDVRGADAWRFNSWAFHGWCFHNWCLVAVHIAPEIAGPNGSTVF